MPDAFEPLDFHRFHREELPRRLRAGNGALAAADARRLGSLAFRLPDGAAYTYLARGEAVEVEPGDEQAETVIELAPEIWQNVVYELDAAAGLLYGGRAHCKRGNPVRWLAWEPALRAMISGRPIYDAQRAQLQDRRGQPLDPAQSFQPGDDREEMAHFLRSAGYLFARRVFSAEEIAGFLAEAEQLRAEAVPGDKLSWWGKDAKGEAVLCRVTRAAAKPRLRSLPGDPRILALKDLADEPLEHRRAATDEEGVSIIWKHPEMREGLSDLPWHRDCGMGGHAIMCPVLVVSVFLTPATAESGALRMLPGSWQASCGPIDARDARAPRGVIYDAQPGDVSLHYGDTMHAAPPPTRDDLPVYRVSAVTGYARPGARPHRGCNYNEVLHRREDGQVEHLTQIAGRSPAADDLARGRMTARERTPSVLASGLAFGEGPRWHAGRLWLSDMHDFQVVTVDPAGRLERVLRVDGRPSGLGWLPDTRMLVVSMEQRKLLRWDGRSLETHADLSAFASHEINDLVVDGNGLAYVSQFGYAFHRGGEFRKTEILLVTPDGRVSVAAPDLAFPNGMVITPDGRRLIVGESFAARLTVFERRPDGTLGDRRVFAKLSGAVPDGICVDAEGCVWVASPVSRECLRVREGGEVVERVRTQAQSIACMLGGADRRTLFVLTSEGIDSAECAQRRSARVEFVEVDVPGAGWP